ncbi:MAG: hypothetical protein HZB91_02190 [Elusimicrobia bacterium]|nr:hypothetical protein [Elusimicrobiota bacterium]
MIVIFLFPSTSHALKKPPQTKIDEINAAIKKAQFQTDSDHDKKYWALKDEKKAIEHAIGLTDEKGNLLRRVEPDSKEWRDILDSTAGLAYNPKNVAERYRNLKPKVKTRYSSILKEFKPYQEESTRLRKKAIELTRKAYGIDPPETSGPIRSGAPCHRLPDGTPDPDYVECHIDKQASWNPVFSENLGSPEGVTYPDGHVSIGPNAFAHPGTLAYAIYHEGEHFQNLLAEGADLRNEPGEEVMRRETDRAMLESEFDFTPGDLERFDEKLKKERERARQWDEKLNAGLDPYKKRERDAFPKDIDLTERAGESPKISEALKEIWRKARELDERQKAEAKIREQLQEYGDIAMEVCLSRRAVTQERLNALPRLDPQAYRDAIPKDKYPHCQHELYEAMLLKLANGERLDAAWVNSGRERSSEETGKRRHLEEFLDLATAMCGNPDKVPESALRNLAKYDESFYAGAPRIPDVPFLPCHLEGYRHILDRLARSEPIDRDRMIRLLLSHEGTPPTPPFDAAGYLHTIAVYACQDPGSINYDRFIVYVDRWHFPNRRLLWKEYWADGLDACAKELYWKLIEFNDTWSYGQTLNPEWLNAEGKRLKEKHSKPQPTPNQPAPSQPAGGGGSSGGGGGGINPKPSMPRNPNWDGRGPR